jgi:TolA-binding protein
MVRKGNAAKALEICNSVLKESTRPETLAQAYVTAGQAHLVLKEWDPALLAFLEIPVFYPDDKVLYPQSMLGSGQAYEALQDFTRAKLTFNELISKYAATSEAEQAKTELAKIARTEKALDLVK